MLTAACTAPTLFAQDAPPLNPTGRVLELSSPVEDGSNVVGSLLVRIDTDDTVSVEFDALLALFEQSWSEALLDRLRGRAVDGRMTLGALEELLGRAEFDTTRLTLVLQVPANARRRQVIGFGDARGEDETTRFDRPAPVSAFLNLRVGADFSQMEPADDAADGVGATSEESVAVGLDGLARLGGPVLAYDFASREDAEGGISSLARRSTQLLVDLPTRESRLSIGDLSSSRRTFQASVDLLGVGIGRDFALSPGRNIRPRGSRSFELDRPASVSVVANGEVLRTFELREGVYDLEDLPLVGGNNLFELLIEDETGEIERIAFSALYDAALLDVGELDYNVLAGVVAETGEGSIDYLSEQPFASAFALAGVLPWLSVGVNAQLEDGAGQLGVELLSATPIGPVALDLSVSHGAERGSGYAVGTGYRGSALNGRGGQRTFGVSLEYAEASFDEIDGTPNENADVGLDVGLEDRYSLFASYAEQLGGLLYGSLSASHSRAADSAEASSLLGAGLQGRLPVAGQPSWSLQTQYEHDPEGRDEFSVSIGVSLLLDARNAVSTSYSGRDESLSLNFRRRVNTGQVGGYAASVTLEGDAETDTDASAELAYVGNRFFASVEQSVRAADIESGARTLDTALRFESAFALAGRRFAIGRPIGDSFAIVSGHPSLGGRTLRLDPGDDGDIARSSFLGAALLPSAGRYRARLLSYSVDDLPLGYDLGAGLFRLNAPLGAGYDLTVGSAASVTVIGNLVDAASGEPLALAVGNALPSDDPDVEPIVFFTNRVGKFALPGITPGRYRLALDTAPPRVVELEVEESEESFIRIGELLVP